MNLLTSEEMAKVLRCSYQTFNRLVKRKALPFYEVGRMRMFDANKVLAMLETFEKDLEVPETKIKKSIQPSADKKRFAEMLELR